MSIFSYEQTFKDIQEGKESIALICLKCKHMMAVTNYSSFGCQSCQTRYTFESYQLQFNSMFMGLLLNNGNGGAASPGPTTQSPTTDKPKVESPPTNKPQEPKQITLENMFDHIYSFDDIKRWIRLVLKSQRKMHLLITGPPGQGKTVFLDAVKALYPDAEYLDSTMLTKAGLREYLKKKPKTRFLLLDEVDKLPMDQQMILLNLLAKGLLRALNAKDDTEMHFPNLRVIATGNDVKNIYEAVRNRFRHIHMDRYTKDEFSFIANKILVNKYKFDKEFSKTMTSEVWDSVEKASIRGLEQIAQALEIEGQTMENLKYHIDMNMKYDSPI